MRGAGGTGWPGEALDAPKAGGVSVHPGEFEGRRSRRDSGREKADAVQDRGQARA